MKHRIKLTLLVPLAVAIAAITLTQSAIADDAGYSGRAAGGDRGTAAF